MKNQKMFLDFCKKHDFFWNVFDFFWNSVGIWKFDVYMVYFDNFIKNRRAHPRTSGVGEVGLQYCFILISKLLICYQDGCNKCPCSWNSNKKVAWLCEMDLWKIFIFQLFILKNQKKFFYFFFNFFQNFLGIWKIEVYMVYFDNFFLNRRHPPPRVGGARSAGRVDGGPLW